MFQAVPDDDESTAIPRIFSLSEAADLLRVNPKWLRTKLADRHFEGLKRAGRWAMTEPQILAAIAQMTTKARPRPVEPDPAENPDADANLFFSGLSKRSQTYWRNKEITGSTRRPGRKPKSG